ncbi:MAG: FHA domain-containing protein [Myxococcota bacterium]
MFEVNHTIYVVGPEPPRLIPVDTELVVGRGAECALRFPEDRRMSRRHARFVVDAGVLHIEDLGGVNGTHVNDIPVRGRLRLNDGDLIKLGKTEIRVGTAETETPTRPDLVKPADRALPPDLDHMVVDEFYTAMGLGDQTLVDAGRSPHDIVHQSRRLAVLNQFSNTVQRADSIDRLLNDTLGLLLKESEVLREVLGFLGADAGADT